MANLPEPAQPSPEKQNMSKQPKIEVDEKQKLVTTIGLTTHEVSARVTRPSPIKSTINLTKVGEMIQPKRKSPRFNGKSLSEMIRRTYGFLKIESNIAKSDFSGILRTPIAKVQHRSDQTEYFYIKQTIYKSTIPSLSCLWMSIKLNIDASHLQSYVEKRQQSSPIFYSPDLQHS